MCGLIIGQNLNNFPASWGQVVEVDLLTLTIRLRVQYKKQRNHFNMTSHIVQVFFPQPVPNFQC